MQILLTGGTGFIGSNFIEVAHKNNLKIKALSRCLNPKTKIPLSVSPYWIYKSLNETTPEDFLNVDLVVHLAAHTPQPPYDNLFNCLKVNLFDSLSMLENAYIAGVKKFLIAGTCFEYGSSGMRYKFIPPSAALEPTLPYPASKAAASISFLQWAKEKDVSLSIKRIFQVYGEGEDKSRLYPSLIKAAKDGKDFPMTKGDQIRDFINVLDVAKLLVQECIRIHSEEKSVRVSNIGTGNPTTLKSFSEEIWNKLNAKGQLLIGSLDYRQGEIMRYIPNINEVYLL